ncbi:MAG: class I SAM-dependent methyltransferase [Proteobacteria bacterium]|nr:class I SAM-dependent methyltransferase [Pseudomonadota bacterium]
MQETKPILNSEAHWPHIARIWQQVTPPLRPSKFDLAIYQSVLDDRESASPLRILVLGVTPEIRGLNAPLTTVWRSVDRSGDMIKYVWPGNPNEVQCTTWDAMDFPHASFDIVFCDGGLCLLAYPDQHTALAEKLSTILRPGGQLVIRLFCGDGRADSVDDVLADLAHHKIPNLSVLKLRLWVALQTSVTDGVRPHDVWSVISRYADHNLRRLAEGHGRPIEHVLALENHKDSDARYHLLQVADVEQLLVKQRGQFKITGVHRSSEALGNLTPIVRLERL